MGKKAQKRRTTPAAEKVRIAEPQISLEAEYTYKKLTRIMSWIVGICFTLIIILPNFEFSLLDFTVKFIFFLGIFILLLFAILEFMGGAVKRYITRYHS